MEAGVILRTGSGPTQASLALGSPRGPSPDAGGISFLHRSRSGSCSFPRSVHLEARGANPSFLRTRSEANLIEPDGKIGRRALPADIAEDVEKEEEEKDEEAVEREALLWLGISDRADRIWKGTVAGRMPEEVEFSGGGMGKGKRTGFGDGGGGGDDGRGYRNAMRSYYEETLKADPGNPLLLRNYGKFLHEVEGDVEKAEEYYGQAILADPEDGEVLSLYGQMLWDNHKDEGRAGDYFERAVAASPGDCFVLGSYANFLWNSEDDEEEVPAAAVAPVI